MSRATSLLPPSSAPRRPRSRHAQVSGATLRGAVTRPSRLWERDELRTPGVFAAARRRRGREPPKRRTRRDSHKYATTTADDDEPDRALGATFGALKSVVTPLCASPLAAAAFATAPPATRRESATPNWARAQAERTRTLRQSFGDSLGGRRGKEGGPRSAGARGGGASRARRGGPPRGAEPPAGARHVLWARAYDIGFSHGVASRWWAGRRRARRRCRRGRCAAASSRSSAPCRRRRSRPTPSRRCRTCRTRAS